MTPKTRSYLDGPWELRTDTTGQHGAIYVNDKPILRLDVNEPRILARDVGSYLMELKRDRERLNWVLKDCLVLVHRSDELSDYFDTREQIDAAIDVAQKAQAKP